MTRIGIVTSSYPSAPGDPAGAFVAEHARWLRDRGHEVQVLAARPGERVREPGLRVDRAAFGRRLLGAEGAPEVLERKRGRVDALAVTSALLVEAGWRSRHWDRLIAHWLVPSGLVAAAIARGRPLHAIAHSGDVHLLRRLGLVTPVAAALVRAGATLSFVSEELRERFLRGVRALALRREVERRSRITAMGVCVDRFRRAAAKRPPGRRPVAFLGRLVPVKGCDVAVAAAGMWKSPVPLAIAGAGPEEGRLRAQAGSLGRGAVSLLGELRGAARDRFVAGAAALILPSRRLGGGRSEGFPVAALEAMAAGVPVIASAAGGLAEIPPGAVTHIPPDDARALARAVDRLLVDEGERVRQVSEAAAWVRGCDWDAVGPRLF